MKFDQDLNLWYELNPRVRCAFGNVFDTYRQPEILVHEILYLRKLLVACKSFFFFAPTQKLGGPKNIPTCSWDVLLEQEEDQTLYLLTPCVTLPQESTLWLLIELAMQTFWPSALFSCPHICVICAIITCEHPHIHIYFWPIFMVMVMVNRRGAQRRLRHLWAPCLASSSLQVCHPFIGCLEMLSLQSLDLQPKLE